MSSRTADAPRISVSPSEASRITGLPDHLVRRLVREGSITSHKIARRSLIMIADLERYIRAQPPTTRPRRKPQGVLFASTSE